MANTRNGNSYYIDTQYAASEELDVAQKGVSVTDIFLTATSANAVLVLSDGALATKLDIREATSGETRHFRLVTPMRFANAIRPTTLTNAVATVVFEERNG